MMTREELNLISDAIRSAESHTSGEIRVCIARRCDGDPLKAAYIKFHKMKMENTQLRNGVLIYLSPTDHKAAILGDKGINEMVRNDFWDDALEEMLACFRREEITDGICKGVGKVGELIKTLYPISDNDINELSNEVILEE
ncbi:MAG: TPM domain-containing protein [Proteiniphilum sp.]|jgi:uncharacterized membrane protein|nr:TPM domain-containing protein [Proteiniphilum sp.]